MTNVPRPARRRGREGWPAFRVHVIELAQGSFQIVEPVDLGLPAQVLCKAIAHVERDKAGHDCHDHHRSQRYGEEYFVQGDRRFQIMDFLSSAIVNKWILCNAEE